jgi:drug/metabolite transporter (DMT)-like permease
MSGLHYSRENNEFLSIPESPYIARWDGSGRSRRSTLTAAVPLPGAGVQGELRAMQKRIATSDVGFALVILAGLGFGLNPLFAKLAYADGMGPAAALTYRFLGLFLVTLPAARAALSDPTVCLRGVALGAGMGLGTLAYFEALAVLPVATAAMVYYTYPLFTVLIGWLVLRRPPRPRAFAAAGLVLVAVALVVSPRGLSPDQVGALIACFLAPLMWGLLLVGFSTWLARAGILARSATTAWGHLLVLVPMALIWGDGAVLPSSAAGWQAALGLATLASLLPQLLLLTGITRAGAERTAIGGSTELMMSVAVGWIVFAEPMRPEAVAGVALLLTAIYVARKPMTR